MPTNKTISRGGIPRSVAEREEIATKVAGGRLLRQVGEEYGITRERVRQICNSVGESRRHRKRGFIKIKVPRQKHGWAMQTSIEDREKAIELVRHGASVYSVAKITGYAPRSILLWCDSENVPRHHRSPCKHQVPPWEVEEIKGLLIAGWTPKAIAILHERSESWVRGVRFTMIRLGTSK